MSWRHCVVRQGGPEAQGEERGRVVVAESEALRGPQLHLDHPHQPRRNHRHRRHRLWVK